jgi:predicted nucleic acid-binding protein
LPGMRLGSTPTDRYRSTSRASGAERPVAIAYFDSSALVKLIVDEEGSDLAAELWDRCDAAVASRLAYPEVCAAIAAAARDHRLDEARRAAAIGTWERYWSAVRALDLSSAVAEDAGKLAADHALRGADAVHLASVLTLGSDVVMAVWDGRLATGARRLGLTVVGALTG